MPIYGYVITLIALGFTYEAVFGMPRSTQSITLPSSSIGARHHLLVHRYAPDLTQPTKKAYIQASLHADELPGKNLFTAYCNYIGNKRATIADYFNLTVLPLLFYFM